MKIILILASFIISLNSGYSEAKLTDNEYRKSKTVAIQKKLFKESQLIGKWYFLSKDNDSKSKSENLLEGKFIVMKTDHHYESDLFNNKEIGIWKFNEKTKILTLKTKTRDDKWKVETINDFGMILINIETNEKWKFSA